jgi:hypothetical protein
MTPTISIIILVASLTVAQTQHDDCARKFPNQQLKNPCMKGTASFNPSPALVRQAVPEEWPGQSAALASRLCAPLPAVIAPGTEMPD